MRAAVGIVVMKCGFVGWRSPDQNPACSYFVFDKENNELIQKSPRPRHQFDVNTRLAKQAITLFYVDYTLNTRNSSLILNGLTLVKLYRKMNFMVSDLLTYFLFY